MKSGRPTGKKSDPIIKAQLEDAVFWGVHGTRWGVHGKWRHVDIHPTSTQIEEASQEGKRLKARGYQCGEDCPVCGGMRGGVR